MSVNKYLPHILVLPEDAANGSLATGFQLEVDWTVQKQLQVLPEVGGWLEVLNAFESDHVASMGLYPHRLVVLLIDFDEDPTRIDRARRSIPDELRDRVFVLGARNEPERLRAHLAKSLEAIGADLAKDCRDGTDDTWSHEYLRHNGDELQRLRTASQWLFQ